MFWEEKNVMMSEYEFKQRCEQQGGLPVGARCTMYCADCGKKLKGPGPAYEISTAVSLKRLYYKCSCGGIDVRIEVKQGY